MIMKPIISEELSQYLAFSADQISFLITEVMPKLNIVQITRDNYLEVIDFCTNVELKYADKFDAKKLSKKESQYLEMAASINKVINTAKGDF
jgi:hypothetical protein